MIFEAIPQAGADFAFVDLAHGRRGRRSLPQALAGRDSASSVAQHGETKLASDFACE